jgi:hypothetical protein
MSAFPLKADMCGALGDDLKETMIVLFIRDMMFPFGKAPKAAMALVVDGNLCGRRLDVVSQ